MTIEIVEKGRAIKVSNKEKKYLETDKWKVFDEKSVQHSKNVFNV